MKSCSHHSLTHCCVTNHLKLSSIKWQQPNSTHKFYQSEIHTGNSPDGLTLLHEAWGMPGKIQKSKKWPKGMGNHLEQGCPVRIQCKLHVVVVELSKSCPTLCYPMDCSPPGSSDLGISQARIMEWVAVSFSGEIFPPREQSHVSCTDKWTLYCWANWEAHVVFFIVSTTQEKSQGKSGQREVIVSDRESHKG